MVMVHQMLAFQVVQITTIAVVVPSIVQKIQLIANHVNSKSDIRNNVNVNSNSQSLLSSHKSKGNKLEQTSFFITKYTAANKVQLGTIR
jgi:hypothetical protein